MINKANMIVLDVIEEINDKLISFNHKKLPAINIEFEYENSIYGGHAWNNNISINLNHGLNCVRDTAFHELVHIIQFNTSLSRWKPTSNDYHDESFYNIVKDLKLPKKTLIGTSYYYYCREFIIIFFLFLLIYFIPIFQ